MSGMQSEAFNKVRELLNIQGGLKPESGDGVGDLTDATFKLISGENGVYLPPGYEGLEDDEDFFPDMTSQFITAWVDRSLNYIERKKEGLESLLWMMNHQEVTVLVPSYVTFDSMHPPVIGKFTCSSNVAQVQAGGYVQMNLLSHSVRIELGSFSSYKVGVRVIDDQRPLGVFMTYKRMNRHSVHVYQCNPMSELLVTKISDTENSSCYYSLNDDCDCLKIDSCGNSDPSCQIIVDFVYVSRTGSVGGLIKKEVTPFGSFHDLHSLIQPIDCTSMTCSHNDVGPEIEGKASYDEKWSESGFTQILDAQKQLLFERGVDVHKAKVVVDALTPVNGNRALCKMDQIFNQICRFSDVLRDQFEFLDLCAAPGNFSRFLLGKTVGTGVAITLGGGPSMSEDLKHERYLKIVYADIKEPRAERFCRPVNLVVADGSEFNEDNNEQEARNFSIIAAETVTALEHLKRNGIYVVKFFGIRTMGMQNLILDLVRIFRSAYLFKPCASRVTNSETYGIFVGMKEIDSIRLRVIGKYQDLRVKRKMDCVLPGFKMKAIVNVLAHDQIVALVNAGGLLKYGSQRLGTCGYCASYPVQTVVPRRSIKCVCGNVYCFYCTGLKACPFHELGTVDLYYVRN